MPTAIRSRRSAPKNYGTNSVKKTRWLPLPEYVVTTIGCAARTASQRPNPTPTCATAGGKMTLKVYKSMMIKEENKRNKCPECTRTVTVHELDMFGGICETCAEEIMELD